MSLSNGTPGLNLMTVLCAVDTAFAGGHTSMEDVALAAVNAMPANASEFDRGMAAGVAVARYLDRQARRPQEAPPAEDGPA